MLFRQFSVSVAKRTSERAFTGPMTLAALAVAACVVTRMTGLEHLGVSLCYFKAFTGHACLTCGTTRAYGHLSRFDLPGAFAIQPLVTAGTLGLMIWGALDAVLYLFSRRTIVRAEDRALAVITAVIVVLALFNWVYLLATGV